MFDSIRSIFLALLVLNWASPVEAQSKAKPASSEAPILLPNPAPFVEPGSSIELVILYPGGLPENFLEVRFVFLQNGRTLVAPPGGGCGELEAGTQTFNVSVPQGLDPGTCQVVAQIEQKETRPIELMIAADISPPVITGQYPQVTSVPQEPPRPAQPGDSVYIEGTNFGRSDEVEITDSQGVLHVVPANSSSSAGLTGFMVPEDIADGEATFEIVEQRSGTRQRSKKVTLQIRNVPLPLEITWNGLRPVAPGQFIDIGFETVPPYDKSHRVEVGFTQNGNTTIVEFLLEPNVELHVQVPDILLPGDVFVRTRTRRDDAVSEWSKPATMNLLVTPAPPLVEAVELIRKIKPDQSEPFIHLKDDRMTVLKVEPGDRIAVGGCFGTESSRTVRLELRRGARHILLKPAASDRVLPTYFEIELPDDLQGGEWQVFVCEEQHLTRAKLPLRLEVGHRILTADKSNPF